MLSPDDSLKNGVQNVDSAFTVGRRNVKNQSVDIENNINDILTFDLKYGNTETSFKVKLDQGKYIGC